jgi:hypothetical protein
MCQVSIIRKRGQYLGTVEVPNEKAAELPWLNLILARSSAGCWWCRSGTSVVVAGGQPVEVARVRITGAGRQILVEPPTRRQGT